MKYLYFSSFIFISPNRTYTTGREERNKERRESESERERQRDRERERHTEINANAAYLLSMRVNVQ